MNMYNNIPQQPTSYYYAPQGYQRQIPNTNNEMSPNPVAPMFYPQQQQNYIKGRPVVSIDEARASQIDLDGSLYVFPDLSNKKIYTKQINMDGTATFNVFELSSGTAPAPVYVTKDELDNILANFKASLTQDKPAEAAPAPAVKQQFNKPFNL